MQKQYLKTIFDTRDEAEKAALITCSNRKRKIAALWGEYPNLQEVVIEFVCTIGEEDTSGSSTIPGTDDSTQTKPD